MKIVKAGEFLATKPGIRRPNAVKGYQADEEIRPYSRWMYILLSCDHYTTPEEIELNSYWKPRRGVYYCERCCKWMRLKPKIKVELPQDPLF